MSNGLPALTFNQLVPLLIRCFEESVSVLLYGHPGVGKSSLAAKMAAHFKLPLIDIRLSQRDPTELAGIQMPDSQTGQLKVFPPDWLVKICNEPHVLLLDEISAGTTKLHQSIAYQILLDRCLGPFKFHPDTLIIAASNLPEDHAIVTPLSDALIDRCAKFILKVDRDSWLDWAAEQNPPLSPDIRAYIAWRGEKALYRRYDFALASPRSWARAARLDPSHTEKKSIKESQLRHLVGSCVGEAAATEFFQFKAVYKQVDIDGFLMKGILPALTPEDPSLTYAFVFALADRLLQQKKTASTKATMYKHIAQLFQERLFGDEYQVLFLNQLMKGKQAVFQDLITHPDLTASCKRLSAKLIEVHND